MRCKSVQRNGELILKYFIAILFILFCHGCASCPFKKCAQESAASKQPVTQEQEQSGAITQCPGSTDLPMELADKFEAFEDAALLKSALGQPKKGGLCQGQVYKSKDNANVTIYRAWNSTNPNSKMGKWWAFQMPEGKVSRYRSDYEICYQWSPLDKLTHCTLKGDVKLVIGTGQSAECSQYLTYPASAEKQIYIEDASTSLSDCATYDGEFSWKAVGD